MNEIQERVKRGALFVEEHYGREALNQIDLDRLNMVSRCDCILGQLTGNYIVEVERLNSEALRNGQTPPDFENLGLTAAHDPYTPFSCLTFEWKRFLQARRPIGFRRIVRLQSIESNGPPTSFFIVKFPDPLRDRVWEAAQRGATFLDQVIGPQWRDQIDLNFLCMSSVVNCILGQLWGEYTVGLDALSLRTGQQLGFATIGNYSHLQQAWEEILHVE